MKEFLCSLTALRWSMDKLARVLDDRRGFSLTELLVSCSLLGMVMAAVGGVIATGTKISTDGDNRAQAQQAARAGMIMEEDLRLAGAGFPPSAVKINLQPESLIRSTNEPDENPAKTTECTAPMRAHASTA